MTLEQTDGRIATRPLGIAMVRGKAIAVADPYADDLSGTIAMQAPIDG